MEDIIGSVADKAGIPEMKAKLAVAAIVERLDGVLPGPIAGQVKKALGIDAAGMMGGVAGGLGDLLGGGGNDEEGGGGLADMAKGLLGGDAEEEGGGGLADMAKGLLGGDDDEDGGGLGGLAKGLLGK